MRASTACARTAGQAIGALLVVAAVSGTARADNVVGRVEAHAEGEKTVVVIHGTATPSFTAYRLEKPARLVVDLANGKLADSAKDSLVDVDSWAVSQISTSQYHSESGKTARVMIGLKRGCTYDAKPKGNDLWVMVTTTDPMPQNAAVADLSAANAASANARAAATQAREATVQAESRRTAVLAQLADEEKRLLSLRDARAEEERREKKQGDAQKAELEATRHAEAARADADTAKARAVAARAELERLQITRAAEEQKIAELSRRAAAGGAAEQQQLAQLRAAADHEQARLAALKIEAEKLARTRTAELRRIDEAQASARAAAEKREKALDDARIIADRRAQEATSARLAEERRAQAQADEASRLAIASQKLASSQDKQKNAEQAAQRMAAQARADEARVKQLRAEADRITDVARVARAQVEAARVETQQLVETQTRERARLESSRTEAKRLADQRQLEMERAAHATAMVSGQRVKMEAAEQEAKRFAEVRQKESVRLDAIRKSAEDAVTQRAEELRKIDDARTAQKATVLAHERELASLSQRRDRELKSLAEARAGEEAKIAATRDELRRTKGELEAIEQRRSSVADSARAELAALESQRNAQKEEVARTRAEVEARHAEQARLDGKIATARAELDHAEKQAKLAAVVTPMPVAAMTPHTKELARAGVPFTSKIADVRFTDDVDSHRIVIDMQGEPEWRTMPSQKGELTLSLKGAELPRRLERTLDTAAYRGPVRSVSTYGDPSEPGSVRIVVTLDPAHKGGEPRITKEGNRLVWEFPREARSQSIAPLRVGGYGASIPLAISTNATSLPQPGTSHRRSSYSGRRIDLDFKDFDIHNILRMISDVGQVNIITSDDVKGSITIRMRDVPWDQALDVILKAKSLGMQREGNLIRVAPLAVLEKELEADLARAKASIELKPLDTRLIPLSYAQGDKMLPRVAELLSSRGKVSVDERTNMLIVSDVASNIALAEDLIRNLDTQTPQVLIEARIVEASQNFTRQVGIQWGGNTLNSASTGNPTGLSFPSTVGVAGQSVDPGTPASSASALNPNYVVNLPAATSSGSGGALGIALGSLSGAYNINLRLSALESTGQVRIVSSPKITTLDNVEASIEQGTAIPISVVSAAGTNTIFVDAKLNLTVKPHVTNEGSIAMSVAVTRNEPDFGRLGARGDPTILKRQAKTEMLVRDGDTAVIGGIYTRNSGTAYQKLPWVADIPILGWLFKTRRENDDRTELLIFITPRVVNRQMVAR
ncbi:MAG: type IV pilus secretin PilQ [Polyangia bacterium]